MLIFLLACLPFLHDYHITITQMRYKSAKQTLEAEITFFIDDFERALQKQSGKNEITLGEGKEYDTEIIKYVFQNLKIQNSKQQVLQGTYLKKKVDDERVKVFVSFPAKGYSSKWRVLNTALTDIYHDQTNMVNCFYDDEGKARTSHLFLRGSTWENLP